MSNRWTGGRREPNPLLVLAGLLAALNAIAKPPRLDHPHYWVFWTVSMIASLVTFAVCVYCFIDLWQYMQHTTPCQRMGTC